MGFFHGIIRSMMFLLPGFLFLLFGSLLLLAVVWDVGVWFHVSDGHGVVTGDGDRSAIAVGERSLMTAVKYSDAL